VHIVIVIIIALVAATTAAIIARGCSVGASVVAGTRSRTTSGGSNKFLRSKKAKRLQRELVDIDDDDDL
jgi:hypothetical protein